MPSIIVPARNSRDFTQTCLGSILHAVSLLKLDCEFVLIDDESDPAEGILDVFREFRERAKGHAVKIIRSRTHQHYSGVFSIGLHHSTHDLIFFISNDMIVPARFLQGLLLVSALSPQFGVVRGTSNWCDNHPQHAIEPPDPPRSYKDVEGFAQSVFAANACTFVEDELLSGDAILLKRSVVERIGVLDLRFFGYFGDIDYGMRAHLAGFKLVCARGAWLFHEGAGHVKRDIARTGRLAEELHRRRMEMVEAAFQEFRRKWHIESPASYDSSVPTHYFRHAETNAGRVPLKVDFPLSVLDDLEYH